MLRVSTAFSYFQDRLLLRTLTHRFLAKATLSSNWQMKLYSYYLFNALMWLQ